MKSYLSPKPNRLRVDINLTLYTSLILIIMSTLLMMMVPLLRQPIALHELAQIKTQAATKAPIIITIHKENEYQLNTEVETKQALTLEMIKTSLARQFKLMDPKHTSICIKSDIDVPYGKIIELIDWLQARGAEHIGLLTSTSDAKELSL